ncbi:cilia- and flagella-associated protein 91 [Echeneis naucrates]|uniref:cilia- and flagella-associated protein 91 n=1 Tax=Echeneis naucrates TaxID=173247 RepID=UPI0011145BFC|nr:cilia- and flagella-associated protein 91 [Echeneis naucrates]
MSASATHTITEKNHGDRAVRRQRAYDYLYDPVYTVSSEADHARSSLKAYANKDRLRRVPEFGSMFSSLPHYPRYTVHLDQTDPVPASVDRGWRGHAEQRREALQQLAGVFTRREECCVTGADRWKYFKRPLIPFAQHIPPDVIYALTKEDFAMTSGQNAEQQPTHRTVGIQTDYRESETQTDPYSPEYVIQPGTTPSELLKLAALTWGHGLPAGLPEVEMIVRARAKQAWEASLPPLSDLSQLDKRRRMMEEMEAKEWAFREGEIQKLQETRLAVLKDLLKQRDEAQKEVTNERLNQIYSKLQKDKEIKQQKLQNDYLRSVRKLEAKKRNEERKLERLGLNSRDSRKYAPQSHRETFSRRSYHNDLKINYLDTYEGLQELEAGLSASVLKPWRKTPKPKVNVIKERRISPASRAVELMKKYKALREEESQTVPKKPLRYLVKKEKPEPQPLTPRVEGPPEGDEELELAVIHLQKLLRGRSIQCEMFKGKENHLELIQELRTVHALQKEEEDLQKADKEHTITLKKQRDKHRHMASQEEASLARMVGTELDHVFDTLSKELIRLQEERRIHAFAMMAERDRRLREAEESGRRQVEERRRREEDEIFRQVVQVHQATVDLYLEDIILDAMEKTAGQEAREEIHRRAKEINDIAYAMEESSRNDLQSEEIVSELVYSFLIPEVEKIRVRQRVHKRQRRHLQAAHSIIHGTAENSGMLPSTQSTCPSEKASNHVLKEMISQNQPEQHHHQTE